MIAPDQVIVAKSATSLRDLISTAVVLKRAGRHLVGLCPFHPERTPSFSVYDDHYFCFGCGANGDAIDWLQRTRGMSFQAAVTALSAGAVASKPQRLRPAQPYRLDKFAAAAGQIWREGLPAEGSPVEAYLNFRGVALPSAPVIRFHARCPMGSNDRLPAMIALMTDPLTSQPTGIHRTFIKPDGRGKAEVETAKMMLGRAGIIRLVADEDVGEGLGLAEGIETALAVTHLLGWGPVWSACTSGGIRAFPVLPERALTIFADGDAAGIEAASTCSRRWSMSGAETIIHAPPPGLDWLDAVSRRAA